MICFAYCLSGWRALDFGSTSLNGYTLVGDNFLSPTSSTDIPGLSPKSNFLCQCSLLSVRTWSTCSRRLLFLRRKGKHGFKCEFGWAVFNFPCKLLLNNDPYDISCIFHIFLYLNHGVNEYHTLSLICNNLPINRTSKKAWNRHGYLYLKGKSYSQKEKGVSEKLFFRFWNEQKSNQSNCKGRKKGQRDYKMTFNDPHWPQNHINVN